MEEVPALLQALGDDVDLVLGGEQELDLQGVVEVEPELELVNVDG